MDNLKGMGWMTLSMLGFALSDTFIKLTLDAMPVGQVISIFGLGGALILAVWAKLAGARLFDPALASVPFAVRVLSEVFGTFCFVMALSSIELSLLSAIIQANPLLVTLGAAVFLGMAVGWRRLVAILIGLIGVLIIVRPGMEGFRPETLWAVGATFGLVGRDLSTRLIPNAVPTTVLALWGSVAAGLAGLLLFALGEAAVMPDRQMTFILGGALVCAMVGNLAITAAMRIGEIAVVTPFRYTRLVFALVLAYFVFGERPDLWTLVGAAIVIATGLFTLWRERVAAA